MPFVIDAHEDLAYSMLTFGRDYRRSAYETRRLEQDGEMPNLNGHALLGWPEYQRGQVAIVFSTLFAMPKHHASGPWENQVYRNPVEGHKVLSMQADLYERMCDESPDKFRLVRSRADLSAVLAPWEQTLADPVENPHPTGLVFLMEGAEGIADPAELVEWWERGLRILGPVWAGTRFCGSTYEPGPFTREGQRLLVMMAELGLTLDIAHMSEEAALEALDRYPGPIVCSHANASALLYGDVVKRHLSDHVLRRLFERDGLVGLMPFNRFLLPGWKNTDPREQVSLIMYLNHIDHVCQLAGSARHTAIGTDYDGGFGWPAVPLEIDTIADLQKLAPMLSERGYAPEDIDGIFSGNWRRHLENTLPE